MDIDELLKVLNKAFADEWLAYYQYWIGAKIIKGPMKEAAEAEMLEHAEEELGHADMIADRIVAWWNPINQTRILDGKRPPADTKNRPANLLKIYWCKISRQSNAP